MKRAAFTLVELLVVIAIIGILIGFCCLPSTPREKPAAECVAGTISSNWAWHPSITSAPTVGFQRADGVGLAWDPDRGFEKGEPGGWTYNILPYLEFNAVYEMGEGAVGMPRK